MQFGAYIVERPVEQRGNVTIYAAKHESSADAALITVFTPETMNEAYRWAERLAAIQKLQHANLIIPTEGQRTQEGVAFTITPLIPPLLGRERVLSPFATVEVTRQISAALDYAHGQGVVHGTIKPAHIGKMGEKRYVLRGLEIAGGEPYTFTAANDIETLGQFVHRALAGQPIVDGAVSNRLPRPLADAIRKTIPTAKGKGYTSAGAFHAELTEAIRKLPSALRSEPLVSGVETVIKPALQKRRSPILPLLFVLFFLIAAAAGGYVLFTQATIAPPLPTVAPLQIETQPTDITAEVAVLSESSTPTMTQTPVEATAIPTEVEIPVIPTIEIVPGLEFTETASAETMATLPGVITATPFFIPTNTPGPTPTETSTPPATATDAPTLEPQPSKPCVSLVGDSVTHGGTTYGIPDGRYIIGLTTPLADYLNQTMRSQGLNDLIAYDRGASNTGINSENHPSYFRSSAYANLLEDNCKFSVIMPWFNDISPGQGVSQLDAAPQHVRAIIAMVRELATRNPKGRIFVMNYYDGAVAPFAAATWASGFTASNRELYNREIKLSCDFGSLSQIPQAKCLNSSDAFQGMGDSYVIGVNPATAVLNELIFPLNDVQQSWIDEFMAINPQGLLQGDGIHMSDGGKRAMAAYIVQAMQSLPPEP